MLHKSLLQTAYTLTCIKEITGQINEKSSKDYLMYLSVSKICLVKWMSEWLLGAGRLLWRYHETHAIISQSSVWIHYCQQQDIGLNEPLVWPVCSFLCTVPTKLYKKLWSRQGPTQ